VCADARRQRGAQRRFSIFCRGVELSVMGFGPRVAHNDGMGLVEDIYGSGAADPAPPEAARWAFFVAQGLKPVCTFIRRHDGGSWGSARIVVAYPDAQPAVPPDPVVPWEPVLEDWLLAHRVAAISPDNEAERIGFDLRARLGAIEKRCAGSTFNAVLLRFLYDHGCPHYVALEKKLGAIRPFEPSAAEARTDVCQAIKAVVRDVTEAVDALGYTPEVAKEIRSEALAYYLRDRFEIETRQREPRATML
jgi:hypothetical protein